MQEGEMNGKSFVDKRMALKFIMSRDFENIARKRPLFYWDYLKQLPSFICRYVFLFYKIYKS